jgi:hypothetical protein
LNSKYSVRAIDNIDRGQIIENCPFTVLHGLKLSREPEEALQQMDNMFVLEDVSEFTKQNGPRLIVAGGNAPFYSHSYDPNAYVIFDHITKVITIKALKNISASHEITIYRYGSYQVMKNNMEIQKFYQQRQKELQEKNVDSGGFRSMSSSDIKNIETVEVKPENNS